MIPEGGYNKLFEGILDGADTLLDIDFFKDVEKWKSIDNRIVLTGKTDEYFEYCYGKLEYRTVRFETEILDMPNYLGKTEWNRSIRRMMKGTVYYTWSTRN